MRKVWRRWAVALALSLIAHAAFLTALLWRKPATVMEEQVVAVELVDLIPDRRPPRPADARRAVLRQTADEAPPPASVEPLPSPPALAAPVPAAPAGRPDGEALARAVVPQGPVDCSRPNLSPEMRRRCALGPGVDERFAKAPAGKAIPRYAMAEAALAQYADVAEHKRKCREDYRGANVPSGHVVTQGGGPGATELNSPLGSGWTPSILRPCL